MTWRFFFLWTTIKRFSVNKPYNQCTSTVHYVPLNCHTGLYATAFLNTPPFTCFAQEKGEDIPNECCNSGYRDTILLQPDTHVNEVRSFKHYNWCAIKFWKMTLYFVCCFPTMH